MLRSLKFFYLKNQPSGTSLAVQWLRFHVTKAGDVGLSLCWITNIQHAMWYGQTKKRARESSENPLVVRWLGLQTLTAEGLGSIPGWRIKIS